MTEQNPVLVQAIWKLALAGEQAGLSVEEMIELLRTGVSVETLLNLICRRLSFEGGICNANSDGGGPIHREAAPLPH
jgi:hypothetical protein